MTFFVDTSMWYAAADRGDAGNRRAKEILATDEVLLTTDHVLVEAWSLLAHCWSRDAAERFWEGIRSGVAPGPPTDASRDLPRSR